MPVCKFFGAMRLPPYDGAMGVRVRVMVKG